MKHIYYFKFQIENFKFDNTIGFLVTIFNQYGIMAI